MGASEVRREAPPLSFVSADELGMVRLVALWNRAYEAYLVPFVVDEAGLATHVRRAGILLARSVVAVAEGHPVAISVAAIRGRRAWIGGFGVALEWRRRGVAKSLLEHHLARLAPDVDEVSLEVLEENPARALYASVGFRETSELVSLIGSPSIAPSRGRSVSLEELTKAHHDLNRAAPTWRREWPSIEDAVRTGAVMIGVGEGDLRAYAVARSVSDTVIIGDAIAADSTSAEHLFAAIVAHFPAAPVRLVDDRAGSHVSVVGQSLGLVVAHRQRGMVCRLGESGQTNRSS